jgi:hypothetical protein
LQYLVVWNDYRNTGSGRGSDIYGKRVGADGAPNGSDFRISGLRATANEEDPVVAWSETGNLYFVVWTDKRGVGGDPERGSDLYGRRLQADLSPVGGDFRVSGPKAVSWETEPALAWNAQDDQYLVVWTDFRSPAGVRDADIYGRTVNG